MIQFPEHFIPLKKYPGYYWNDQNKKLYSIKVSGVLKELKLNNPVYYPNISISDPYYSISHNGIRRLVFPHRIEGYLDRTNPFVIPVQKEIKYEQNQAK